MRREGCSRCGRERGVGRTGGSWGKRRGTERRARKGEGHGRRPKLGKGR
uniref:Uncharacterized protein n=1 Tax=Arundo donax TaxID=35708 RepID=A0A0A9DY06_ARUDO